MLYGKIGVTFVYNCALRKFDFGATLSLPTIGAGGGGEGVFKGSTQGQTALKNGNGTFAAGSYLQRGSAPLPGNSS